VSDHCGSVVLLEWAEDGLRLRGWAAMALECIAFYAVGDGDQNADFSL